MTSTNRVSANYYLTQDELTNFPAILSKAKNSPYAARSERTIVLGEFENASEPQKIIILSASIGNTGREDQIAHIAEFRDIAKRMQHDATVAFCSDTLMEIYHQQMVHTVKASGGRETESKLISAFDEMLSEALTKGASDIHIEIRRLDARIRYRIDGELIQMAVWSKAVADRFVQAIYSVVAEEQDVTFKKDQAQDAVIDTTANEERIRVRLATIPAAPDGFDCIMRLLPLGKKDNQKPTALRELGYSSDHVRLINMGLIKPVGCVFIAGTTGSGKSTTLKNMLLEKITKADGSIKVITVENPVEYVIEGATQVPVSKSKNTSDGTSSFEDAAKAAMRCDPDILMIGEVRDQQSANLLVSAVQSGHRAFTTVHAGSAIGIIGRLADMKVGRDTLGSTDFISCLIFQALLPKLCPYCKITIEEGIKNGKVDEDMVDRVRAVSHRGESVFVCGSGCDKCTNGIKGRTVVAEVIYPDFTMLKFFSQGKSIDALEHWTKNGGKLIIEHGIEKMHDGIVSPYDIEEKLGSLTAHLVMTAGSLSGDDKQHLPEQIHQKTVSRHETSLVAARIEKEIVELQPNNPLPVSLKKDKPVEVRSSQEVHSVVREEDKGREKVSLEKVSLEKYAKSDTKANSYNDNEDEVIVGAGLFVSMFDDESPVGEGLISDLVADSVVDAEQQMSVPEIEDSSDSLVFDSMSYDEESVVDQRSESEEELVDGWQNANDEREKIDRYYQDYDDDFEIKRFSDAPEIVKEAAEIKPEINMFDDEED